MSLLTREWKNKTEHENQLTILQWNCLADWASYAFPKVAPEFLEWSHRRPLVAKECLRSAADLICLQEVDRFDELAADLGDEYDGRFLPKPGRSSDKADGAAIFWKKSMVTPIAHRELSLTEACNDESMKQVALAMTFECPGKNGASKVELVTTHLKAKSEFESTRARQAAALSDFITALEHESQYEAVFLCGDFNTVEDSEALTIVKSKTAMKSVYRELATSHTSHELEFPKWTTWKIRNQVKKTTIDFILYKSTNWIPKDVWAVPFENEIDPEIALPCEKYPSDHVALAAKFALK